MSDTNQIPESLVFYHGTHEIVSRNRSVAMVLSKCRHPYGSVLNNEQAEAFGRKLVRAYNLHDELMAVCEETARCLRLLRGTAPSEDDTLLARLDAVLCKGLAKEGEVR